MFKKSHQADGETIEVTVGHWTDLVAQTGCTVIAFDRPAQTVVDVRGGAPGTRETDLLAPGRLVREVDAIVLAGGSAFGLATADGVMQMLRERGKGISTPAGPVPIVPAAIIFDLGVGQPVAPNADSGRMALQAAGPVDQIQRGRVGVGAGATSGKLARIPGQRGGFGTAEVPLATGAVRALVVVNSAGVVVHPETGVPVHGVGADVRERLLNESRDPGERQSTTIGVVLVAAPCDEAALLRCAVAAHDGIARAVRPAHTIFDGDVVFAVGLERGTSTPAEILSLSTAAEIAMERAIVDAVTT